MMSQTQKNKLDFFTDIRKNLRLSTQWSMTLTAHLFSSLHYPISKTHSSARLTSALNWLLTRSSVASSQKQTGGFYDCRVLRTPSTSSQGQRRANSEEASSATIMTRKVTQHLNAISRRKTTMMQVAESHLGHITYLTIKRTPTQSKSLSSTFAIDRHLLHSPTCSWQTQLLSYTLSRTEHIS